MAMLPSHRPLVLTLGLVLLAAQGMAQESGAPRSSPVEWRPVSSPDRAEVFDLIQSQDGTLFASTRAGLFASQDLGESWLRRGPASHPVGSLLSTREGALLSGAYRQGIARSTDDGESWTPVGFERNVYITGIIQDSAGRIYAAVNGSVGDEPSGVFHSDDDGRTWTASGRLDEAVRSLGIPAPGLIYAGTERGLFRSGDRGRTWIRVGELPSGAPVSHVVAFKGEVFAAMGAALLRIPGGGVARSSDGGQSWQPMAGLPAHSAVHSLAVSGGELFAAVGDFADGGGKGVYRLAADARWQLAGLEDVWIRSLLPTPRGLFAGAIELGVFHSDDGRTWHRRSSGLRNWEAHSLAVDDSGSIYALSLSGLFRSEDDGRRWSEFPLPERSAVPTPWSIVAGPEGTLILGGKGGILVSESRGESWDYRQIPGESSGVFALTVGGEGDVYAVVRGETAYLSRTRGQSWIRLDLPDVPVSALFPSPSGARFFLGREGFWRWTEESSWQLATEDQAWDLRPCGENMIAATFARGLLRSTDDGRTWKRATENLRPGAQQKGYLTFTSIACLPGGGLLAGTFWDGVFYSSDGGTTWNDATGALPVPTVMDFAVTSSGRVFASTPAGVYVGIVDEPQVRSH